MALNANALATVASFNADTGNTDTPTAERFVNAASQTIEMFLDRALGWDAAKVETLPGTGTTRLYLSLYPLSSSSPLTSITQDGVTVAATDYSVGDAASGEVYREIGWTKSELYDGSIKRTLVVTYKGGYALPAQADPIPTGSTRLPSDIQEACVLLAAHMWRWRGRDLLLSSETVGDASQTFQSSRVTAPETLPPFIQTMLAPYRRHSFQ